MGIAKGETKFEVKVDYRHTYQNQAPDFTPHNIPLAEAAGHFGLTGPVYCDV